MVAPKPNEAQSSSTQPGAPANNATPPASDNSNATPPARVPSGSATSAGAGAGAGGGISDQQLKQVAKLTDEFRKKNGLGPLKWNRRLSAAAQAYAERMSKEDFFDHNAPDGTSPGERISSQGYKWKTWGENIAAGQSLPEKVVEAWIKSPEHKANLLNKDYKEIGVGYAEGKSAQFGDKYPYWVQEFAAPAPDMTEDEDDSMEDDEVSEDESFPSRYPRPMPRDQKGKQEGPHEPKPKPKPKPSPNPSPSQSPSPSPSPIGQPFPPEEDLS